MKISYQLSEVDETTIIEPVTLEEVKAFSGIDLDYAEDDADLEILITSARKRLEDYLNIGLIRREMRLQWDGAIIELPLSPTGEITSIMNEDNVVLIPEAYKINKMVAATLYVKDVENRFRYWYGLGGNVSIDFIREDVCEQIYTCLYTTGYEDGKLPKALKHAILTETDYLLKLKGLPVTTFISPNSAAIAHTYSRNLVL